MIIRIIFAGRLASQYSTYSYNASTQHSDKIERARSSFAPACSMVMRTSRP